jgi:hypothetical protein
MMREEKKLVGGFLVPTLRLVFCVMFSHTQQNITIRPHTQHTTSQQQQIPWDTKEGTGELNSCCGGRKEERKEE